MPETFELSVTRSIAAPRAVVWQAFAERLGDWWSPRPWTTEIIAQELRAGGRSAMVMRGPNGEEAPMEGVYLEVAPGERVVFTDAFTAGWHPQGPFMVGILAFADEGTGTRYTASARHWSEAALQRHRDTGFEGGWGIVADQLATLAEAMARGEA